jgi:RNA polymerase sigma-70 factor, ECF subfamily
MAVELKKGRRVTPETPEKPRAAPPIRPSQAAARQANEEDRALIDRLKAKDEQALELLYRRHAPRVYRQANALLGNDAEAEEIVQEVFLTLYEKAGTFRGEAAFSTWLYRLTLNAALTRLRRKKRSQEIPYEEYLPQYQADGHHLVRPVVDWSQDVESTLARTELQGLLQQALNQLKPVDKAVVVLSDLEGVPNREIGKALGLTVPAVKTRLHRARLFLRGKLAVHLGHSPS